MAKLAKPKPSPRPQKKEDPTLKKASARKVAKPRNS